MILGCVRSAAPALIPDGGASLWRLGSIITDPAGALWCNWLSLSDSPPCPPRQLSQLVTGMVTCFEPFIAGIRFVLIVSCIHI